MRRKGLGASQPLIVPLGYDVSDIHPHHGAASVLGLTRGHNPRRAREITHLIYQLQCSILWILPEGKSPGDRRFLNRAVGRVGRTRTSVSNKRIGLGTCAGVEKEVALEIIGAVVHAKQVFRGSLP